MGCREELRRVLVEEDGHVEERRRKGTPPVACRSSLQHFEGRRKTCLFFAINGCTNEGEEGHEGVEAKVRRRDRLEDGAGGGEAEDVRPDQIDVEGLAEAKILHGLTNK